MTASLVRRSAVLLLLIASSAYADTNLVWSPAGVSARDPGAWRQAQDATLVLAGSATADYFQTSIARFDAVPAAGYVYGCTLDVPVGQTSQCGANWAGERMIAKAEAATAEPPPPPLGVFPPWITVATANDSCVVLADQLGQAARLEARVNGGPVVSATEPLVTHLTCDQLGIEKGTLALVEFRALRTSDNVASAWTSRWPVVRMGLPPDPADNWRIEYVLNKRWAESFTLPLTGAEPQPLCMLDTISTGTRPVYARSATGSRGARSGAVAVGVSPQYPTAVVVRRVECSCTEGFTYGSSWYGRVTEQGVDGFVAACRAYGPH